MVRLPPPGRRVADIGVPERFVSPLSITVVGVISKHGNRRFGPLRTNALMAGSRPDGFLSAHNAVRRLGV